MAQGTDCELSGMQFFGIYQHSVVVNSSQRRAAKERYRSFRQMMASCRNIRGSAKGIETTAFGFNSAQILLGSRAIPNPASTICVMNSRWEVSQMMMG